MYIEIEIPAEYNTLAEKREYIKKIYDWGVENLEDQESWKYFSEICHFIKPDTDQFEFYFENKFDVMAIKLAWS